MKTQQMLSYLRRAVNDYHMIEKGDRVAVGVSGGKDSLALLYLLRQLQRFDDFDFELLAVTIDLGFSDDAYAPIVEYCHSLGVRYICEKTDIGAILFDVRKESNPCSLCSKMRRGALNSIITREGYNKLALGHHQNDVVETFMLSLFFEGRLSTFAPISYMSRADVTLIRPLIYTEERDIVTLAKNLPVVHNPCPANKHTERESMKDILRGLAEKYPDIETRFANALQHPDRYNLWDGVYEKYLEERG